MTTYDLISDDSRGSASWPSTSTTAGPTSASVLRCSGFARAVARHTTRHRSRAGPGRREPLGRRPHSDPSALDGERVRRSRSCCGISARVARGSRANWASTSSSAPRPPVCRWPRRVSLAAGLPFAFVRKPGYRGPRARRAAGPRGRGRGPARAAGRRRDLERQRRRALHRLAGRCAAPRWSACSSWSTCARSRTA